MTDTTQETLKTRVATVVYESLMQICGGGLNLDEEKDEAPPVLDDIDSWTAELKRVAQTTISFPNKKSTSLEGSPHDIEIRTALALFHKCTGRKRKRVNKTRPVIISVSDLGVRRTVTSPLELAELLCCTLEEPLREEGISHDVRPNVSGIICLVTPERAQALRESGKLPCPQCIKWCKGEKGLWWHQQIDHGLEHSVAAEAAASEQNVFAIVPYGPQQQILRWQPTTPPEPHASGDCRDEKEDAFELVKKGELEALKQAIEVCAPSNSESSEVMLLTLTFPFYPKDGFDPRESLDRNGASLLIWAAGSGHFNIVKYLIETYHCSPHYGQKGKRSFSGRTPLHWSARNGHLGAVQYLVDKCHVDIDATTADGTTAFCWASWQGHLPVMKFLHDRGADVQKSNSFGCNAVLWTAQGEGTVETLQWLHSTGLNLLSTNSNGHGALHKAAQRKRGDLCEWLCNSVFENLDGSDTSMCLFDNIGPDTEGCCPSDLAGMAGDDELAVCLAKQETRLACLWFSQLLDNNESIVDKSNRLPESLPKWLQREDILFTIKVNQSELDVWEPWGGVRRILSSLRKGC